MTLYCKTCRRTHGAWTRLNDGMICGRCGTRERNPQIVPIDQYMDRERRTIRRLKSA